jgi:two-component system, OmpR family, response regulator RegX3
VTRVLIVEDEESFADPLAFLLRKEGFTAAVATTGQQALEEFDRNGADIVLLDLMLPGMSGTDVCKQLRQRSAVPVIMVTARDSEIDKVVGLELGADDYVTKPFSLPELLARVRAILRRRQPHAQPARIAFGEVVIDFERYEATRAGRPLQLSPKEYALLRFLAGRAGTVVSRGELLRDVWGFERMPTTRTVDNHIALLRGKLEPDPPNPRHLLTVHGVGYKLVLE